MKRDQVMSICLYLVQHTQVSVGLSMHSESPTKLLLCIRLVYLRTYAYTGVRKGCSTLYLEALVSPHRIGLNPAQNTKKIERWKLGAEMAKIEEERHNLATYIASANSAGIYLSEKCFNLHRVLFSTLVFFNYTEPSLDVCLADDL